MKQIKVPSKHVDADLISETKEKIIKNIKDMDIPMEILVEKLIEKGILNEKDFK